MLRWLGLAPEMAWTAASFFRPIAVAGLLYLGPIVETLMEHGILASVNLLKENLDRIRKPDWMFLRNCVAVCFGGSPRPIIRNGSSDCSLFRRPLQRNTYFVPIWHLFSWLHLYPAGQPSPCFHCSSDSVRSLGVSTKCSKASRANNLLNETLSTFASPG